MKLIDFKQEGAFDALREKMGTNDYGPFELFDPARHITWQEKERFLKEWCVINGSNLHGHKDHLAYKNTHIFAAHENKAHFAYCDQIKKWVSQGRLPEVKATLKLDLLKSLQPCEYCLHSVGYQGFDVYRHRHKEYNEKILEDFDLLEYLGKYPK